MADSNISITAGAGTNVDTRTESTNSHHRQVIVVGDESINNNLARVLTQDVGGSDQTTGGIAVRLAGSIQVGFNGASTSAAVHLVGTGGTIGVRFTDEPRVISYGQQTAGTNRPLIVNTDGAIKVYDIATGTINTVAAVTNITNSVAVHVLSTGGTIAVEIDPGYNVVNAGQTLVIPRSISGTASGVSVSGNTIKAPVTSRLIKVYAFSITTTAQVGIAPRFTNGNGGSPTELWRVALQAPTQGIAGANLAVTPPGYLFATASGETLSLVLDSASLVHYSVAYFLESA